MSYCLNPDCQKPQNSPGTRFCQSCGTKLLLKDLYRAIEPLGQGGFGRTFRAVNLGKFDEPCVLKQFFPQIQGTSALQKAVKLFNQEATRLYELGKHPQIPELISYFEQDQRLYLVQELIEGQNLQQELEQQGAFSEDKIQELLEDLLPVLKFIHEKGIIHRDIKPENIIRRTPLAPLDKASRGDLVLIDFGVSKQITQNALARPGTTIGSPGYAPIEQMLGGEASPSGDLYSVGVTCFHLLTKIQPFDLFVRYGYSWIPNWRQHLSSPVSQELGQVLDKLLQEDVKQRYESADAVIKDLHKSQADTVTPTVVVTPAKLDDPAVMKPQTQNWRCVYTLTGHSKSVLSVANSPDGEFLASCSGDSTIKLWQPSSGKLQRTLTEHLDTVWCVAFSPDGEILASGSDDKTIKLWQPSSGKLIGTLTGHSYPVLCVAFSPDGEILASGSDDKTIKLWKPGSGKLIGTLRRHSNWVRSLAFSKDGRILLSGSDDKTIKLWQPGSGKLLSTLSGHSDAVHSVAFSKDGRTLVSGSYDATIKLWQTSTGTLIGTLTGHSSAVVCVALSPDGQILVSGSDDKTIKLWQISNGKLICTLTEHSGAVESVAFSPDGRTLVSGSYDGTIKIWQCD